MFMDDDDMQGAGMDGGADEGAAPTTPAADGMGDDEEKGEAPAAE